MVIIDVTCGIVPVSFAIASTCCRTSFEILLYTESKTSFSSSLICEEEN